MKFQHGSRWRYGVIAAVMSCAMLIVWQAGASPASNAAGAQTQSSADKQRLYEGIRRGVGSEVRFSTAKDSDTDIGVSIEAAAQFIQRRSNMRMSDETKRDLQNAEMETLRGKRARISIDALTDSLTESAAERIGSLEKKEIERVANTFRATSDGQIIMRVAGSLTSMSREVFVGAAASAPALRQRGELESSIRPLLELQITDRAANLSSAMPEQFGRITADGVTPLQALLIAYSVATDDSLADSQNELARQIVEGRMNAGVSRAEAKAQRLNSPTPYGRNGFFYASPAGVLFNRATVQRLLNPVEGGKGK